MGQPLPWQAYPFPPAGPVRGETVSSQGSGCPRRPDNEKRWAPRARLGVDLSSLRKAEGKASDFSSHPPKLACRSESPPNGRRNPSPTQPAPNPLGSVALQEGGERGYALRPRAGAEERPGEGAARRWLTTARQGQRPPQSPDMRPLAQPPGPGRARFCAWRAPHLRGRRGHPGCRIRDRVCDRGVWRRERGLG